MTAPTTNTPLLSRLADETANRHCSDGAGCACNPEQRQPFVAPWRRRQMDQAAERERQGCSRFEAVADITGAVAL